MEPATEKNGEIAKLAKCLVDKVKKDIATKKKGLAEKGNNTAGQSADIDEKK
jgi:hypothetical protein